MGNTVTRQYLFHNQRGRCHYCNVRMNLKHGGKNLCTRDHIVTKGHGGSNDRTNLVGACITCNNLRGQIPYWAFKAYITLYGRDRKIKDVLRSLSRSEYENQQMMWDAITGMKHIKHSEIVSMPVYRKEYVPRRPLLQLIRRNIQDIVNKRKVHNERPDGRHEAGSFAPSGTVRGPEVFDGYRRDGGRPEADHAFHVP